jgi:gliding motility-associated-like protein
MKNILQIILFLMVSNSAYNQFCFVSVNPLDTTICPGDSVPVVAFGSVLGSGQAFNFNTGTFPSGWSSTGDSFFTSPCLPSPDGTPYYWAATTTGNANPSVTTPAFDINCPGGTINFDFIYAVQGGSIPCEGPDEEDEGMALQYSINGGTTWITIEYYQPDGQILPAISTSSAQAANGATPFTVWNSMSVPIPAAANTTSTMFRWFQQNPTPGGCCDNWGLDNIVINGTGGNCNTSVVLLWSNGLTGTNNTIHPIADSTFTVSVYDTLGNLQCTSTPVMIHVYNDVLTYNLQDYAYSYCPTTNPMVQVTNISGAIPPYSVLWTDAPTSTNNPYALSTGGAEHDSITYHVTVTDGCGFERQDSVILVVNKLLTIDSLVAYDASSCLTDGAVVAYVSGLTINNNQPMYNWHGPGASNPSFINSTVWTNRSPGWYYFTVTDDVCTDSDSVLISIKNPPAAIIDANPLAGCAPFDVTFENNSQNSTHYTWDFGDGTIINENAMNPHTHTYSGDAVIMLVAYDDANCSDTAYVSVAVQTCGCTDPLAINYDPTAVQNDGSCMFPEPVFEIPNIFTPNGDGDNDFFEFVVTNYSNIEFSVVNRWGNTIFQGSGMNPKWDGKVDGVIPSDGVYFITYKITGVKGDKAVEGQTFVHLVR